jgi:hypothetical protein
MIFSDNQVAKRQKEFYKLSSSNQWHRLSSHVSLISASLRDYEQKEKLIVYQRKFERQFFSSEQSIKRAQKWNYRAEKNNLINQIYNCQKKKFDSIFLISPSIDDWLKMSMRKKHMFASMHSIAKSQIK